MLTTYKLTSLLSPSTLEIQNDSALHAGHQAMRTLKAGGGSTAETHFTVKVVSKEFEGKVSFTAFSYGVHRIPRLSKSQPMRLFLSHAAADA